MPRGVPKLASTVPETGEKIGAWYFYGASVLEPPGVAHVGGPAPESWPRWPDGSVGVKIILARGAGHVGPPSNQPPAAPAGKDEAPASISGRPLGPEPTERVQLEVRWRNLGDADPVSVALVGQPLMTTGEVAEVGTAMLRNFPWVRWLTVADAAARSTFGRDHEDLDSMFTEGGATGEKLRRRIKRRVKAPVVKRPGRAGHGDDFYLGIAERYRELRMHGSISPTQTIAREMPPPIGPVSRSTAASWVRIAREKGFLAPGRRGRPG